MCDTVFFILWDGIESKYLEYTLNHEKLGIQSKKKRTEIRDANHFTVDCGKSTTGLFLGILVMSMMAAACKKDKDDPDPAPQPVDLKSYSGTTEQDLAVSLGTAEIGGVLYLVSFSIDLVYHDTVHQTTHQANLSQSASTGIIAFTGGSLLYNGTELVLSGSLENGDANLNGGYTWKYDGVNTYSGTYNTVKQ